MHALCLRQWIVVDPTVPQMHKVTMTAPQDAPAFCEFGCASLRVSLGISVRIEKTSMVVSLGHSHGNGYLEKDTNARCRRFSWTPRRRWRWGMALSLGYVLAVLSCHYNSLTLSIPDFITENFSLRLAFSTFMSLQHQKHFQL